MLKAINLWPPFLGAGIRVRDVAGNFRRIDVELKLRFWNRNYVGSHYGGTIYSMTDPFYMLMLIQNLGRDYIVWDKAADIRFIKPGYGTLRVSFELNDEDLARIKREADEGYKTEPLFTAQIFSDTGELVAQVDKRLYVRRKDKVRSNIGAEKQ